MAPEDHLEELKQELYRQSDSRFKIRRSRLSPFTSSPDYGWRDLSPRGGARRFLKFSWPKIFFIIAFIFFLVMLIVTLFVFWRGSNTVSVGNVGLEITGPAEVKAGEPITLQLAVTNKNNAPLEFVDLIVEYPAGARSADDLTKELVRQSEHLGTLSAGQVINRTLKAVLFGAEGNELGINVVIEYRLAGSNAIFDKTATHQLMIGAAPVDISVKIPPEINSNQEFPIDVEVVVNAESGVENLALLFNYPTGFRFKKALLKPSSGESLWLLGNLKAGAKKGFQIIGTLEGQADEQKTFRVLAGTVLPSDPEKIAVLYNSQEQVVLIKRPFVSLDVLVNGDAGEEQVASSQQRIDVEIEWRNNLPVTVTDGELTLTFTGQGLDPATVSPRNGFFRSSANTVIWDKRTEASLNSIEPGESGKVSVNFSSISLLASEAGLLRNPAIDLAIKFRGQREAEEEAPEQVETTLHKKIKLNSVIQLAAKVLYFTGPLKNEGLLPPKVGSQTTYTMVWSMVNSSNDLEAGRVKAILPPYIGWLAVQVPTNEILTFTPGESALGGGEIVWDLGTVRGGTGVASPPREVAFQIGFTPSVTQAGNVPALLGAPTLEGIDGFTRQPLSYIFNRPLDTNLTSDPQFKYGQDKVVK